MDSTIRNRVTIMSLMAVVPTQTVKADWQGGDTTPVSEQTRTLMRERTGLGNWNAHIGLYGAPALMEIQQSQIADAISHIEGVRLVSREYRGDAKATDVLPQDQAMAGIPNMDLLNFLNWYGYEQTGHLAYGPIIPLTNDDGRQMHELLARHCGRLGRDFGEAYALTPRSMQMFAFVLYDAAGPDDLDRTFAMIADQFDFNGGAARRLTEKLKQALDPVGILNPGRRESGPATSPTPSRTAREHPNFSEGEPANDHHAADRHLQRHGAHRRGSGRRRRRRGERRGPRGAALPRAGQAAQRAQRPLRGRRLRLLGCTRTPRSRSNPRPSSTTARPTRR